ncbi:MAG: efflux RND transporter permease subunit [Firmicutes bacterium]|nr:efflux RND transporter permease subunit [Bacillota bacterium]
MKLIETAVKRRVTVMMLFLCITVLGFVSFGKLGMDLMPDMEMPVALVMTTYSGAGSEEVETMVTETIESAVASVEGVENIYSSSSTGSSMVMVQYDWGADLDMATIDLREQVSMIEGYLPEDADKPIVMKMKMNQMPILVVAINGGANLADLKQTIEDDVVPLIERQSGVASVMIGGGYTQQVDVVVDPQTLENYNLSMSGIVGAIASNNVNMAAGEVVDGGKNINIRLMGKYEKLSDIENVDINLPTGGIVKLKDIASVKLVNESEDFDILQNGQDAIYLAVSKQSDANTVETANNVIAVFDEMERTLPGNVHFNIAMNQAEQIEMAIDNLVNNLLMGALLAVAVLFIFLRSVRTTLVIAISIPISLIATCMLMYFSGMTFNVLTLGGMALGAGMMVDSSIVVLENIQRLRSEGMSGTEAAIKGATQMVLAVVSSTLTTIVVFLPIGFAEGLSSILFKDLALVVSFALLASLVSAVILVPMLCSTLLRPETSYSTDGGGIKAVIGRAQNRVAAWFDKLQDAYGRMLRHCMRHRKTTAIVTGAAVLVSLGLVAVVGMEFMPASSGSNMTVSITLEDGVAKEETDKVAARAEDIIVDVTGDDLENMMVAVGGSPSSMTGSSASNTAQFMLTMVDEKHRDKDIDDMADEMRTRLANIAGAEISVSVGDMMSMSSSSGSGASVNIYGEDLDVLQDISDKIITIMESMPAAREVTSSMEDALPEINLEINASKAAQLGMTVPQVASSVSSYINGMTATKLALDGGNEIDVKVQVPEEYQENLNLILNQKMTSPTGVIYRLGDVVSVNQGTGPLAISRENQERYVSVSCTLVGQDLASFTDELNARLDAELVLPQGYRISDEGSYQQMVEAFTSLLAALALGVALIYMICASLYESFSQPFIIFLTIPTICVGAFTGLFITGTPLDVTGMIGLIMLAGIVVNNAIVLVDSINQLRRDEGMKLNDAIMKAAPLRLRPILMTSLTTILSMLPMAFLGSDGGDMASGMAIVVSFGLAASTFITLLFVPVMYSLFEGLARRIGRRRETSRNGLHSEKQPKEPRKAKAGAEA